MPRTYRLTTYKNGCVVRDPLDNILFEHTDCLTCPLPQCALDYDYTSERSMTLKKYKAWPDIYDLAQAPPKGRLMLTETLAKKYSVTVRTVWRWLEHYHKSEGDKLKFLERNQHGTS